jgi:hypothetical protein
MYTNTDGRGNYNTVSGKLTRRFAQGLTALLGYTFSKSIDTGSAWRGQGDAVVANDANCIIQCEKGLSSYDVPQRLVASVLYELPLGRGKPLGTNWGAVPNQILGGWQISSIINLQSGLVGNFLGARNSLTLQDGARPNATGQPVKLDHPTTGKWFNTAAVVIPPCAAILCDIPHEGKIVKALAEPTKQAFLHGETPDGNPKPSPPQGHSHSAHWAVRYSRRAHYKIAGDLRRRRYLYRRDRQERRAPPRLR